jgi:hypothetical protein
MDEDWASDAECGQVTISSRIRPSSNHHCLGATSDSQVFLLDSQEYAFVCDYPVHNPRFMPLCTLVHGGTSSSDDTASSDYTTSIGSDGARRLCFGTSFLPMARVQ